MAHGYPPELVTHPDVRSVLRSPSVKCTDVARWLTRIQTAFNGDHGLPGIFYDKQDRRMDCVNIEAALEEAMTIDGTVSVSPVDWDGGMSLGGRARRPADRWPAADG